MKPLYFFLHRLLGGFFRCLWRVTTTGQEHLPSEGNGIICANHISAWDPPLLATQVPRNVHFMAKEELFRTFFLSWFLPYIGTVSVHRGSTDRNAIRAMLAYLQEGELCAIFPEGTRHHDGQLHEFLQGATFFALKTGAPLYPAAITGDFRRFRGEVTVRFGPPLNPGLKKDARRDDLEYWTAQLMAAIRNLQEEAVCE